VLRERGRGPCVGAGDAAPDIGSARGAPNTCHLDPSTSPPLSLLLSRRCPDTVNFRLKPVIGATYQTLKEKLSGLGKDIQAVDPSDLDYATVSKQLA
jgi:hypothetical protein